MKLVDAEIPQDDEGAPDITRPPRPPRRRVYTSLIVTLSVLFGTVGIIYWVFPNRQGELLTVAIHAHLHPENVALENPTGAEIRAWSLGVFGDSGPWPAVKEGLVPISASVVTLFKRDLAIVRYELNGEPVSMALRRMREASPRVHRRTEDGLYAVSWHCKKYSCIVVGPEKTRLAWTKYFNAP